MRKLNYSLITGTLATSLLLAACGDGDVFLTSGTATSTTNPGVISQKNFSILADNPTPTVIDPSTGSFTKTDVELTVYVGDRDNQTITDSHTVLFVAEYGLINPPYCETDSSGTCSVTWSAIKPPEVGGPGSDLIVSVTAYTLGEETFTDTNGNGIYDDGDAGFEDLEEPYVDADTSFSFSSGDTVIDVVSTNDPTGVNGQHDIGDGCFNGGGCTHSSLCASRTSVTVWDTIYLQIAGP